MKIGILCSSDWAAFAMGLYKSLKAVDTDVIGYALTRHIFGYEEQLEVITPNNIRERYKDCDVVLMVHSDWELNEYITCPVIPIHTGTKYRQSYEFINTKFNSPISIIALPEFQTLAPNPKYLVGAVESDWAVKDVVGRRIRVGHFPSNPDVKGTEDIVRVLRNAENCEFIYSTERVSHAENLKRIYECDIYVEMLASTQGGKPYGSFGITGLEAAAMGKIVITQAINDNGLYNDAYGVNMLNFVKDELGLKKTLSSLLQYKGDYLTGQMESTKEWMEKNHSYKATGNKLMGYINGL